MSDSDPGESQTTTDHQEIRQWVEERGDQPAYVESTESGDSRLLRIDFPDQDDDEGIPDDISWDEFFETFEENDLTFLYQDETSEGDTSYFNKFVSSED
ncbi:hypothetical protein [Halocatena salina]|uniref:1,4-alpha-glucan branching enzyme n=1 Tax=Halocatena salina TaxID=2934340 RepID=A0A8U0A666_9EURY|nr:hypothetical protein [Halocatena salina]UPM44655.1 hypothetical protein MW046_16585 [Halocatena salina]